MYIASVVVSQVFTGFHSCGLTGFLRYAGTLIKLFISFMSKNFFIEFAAKPKLKSPIKIKLPYLLLCS